MPFLGCGPKEVKATGHMPWPMKFHLQTHLFVLPSRKNGWCHSHHALTATFTEGKSLPNVDFQTLLKRKQGTDNKHTEPHEEH